MTTIACTIAIGALFTLCYLVNRREIMSPEVLFCAGFLFSILWTVAYSATWSYEMTSDAFFVVLGGLVLFVTTCFLLRGIVFNDRTWSSRGQEQESQCSTIVPLGFCILQLIVAVWFLRRVSEMYPSLSLGDSIAEFKYAGTFTADSTYLGFPLNPLRFFCMNAAYVTGFFFVKYLFIYKRIGLKTWFLGISVLLNCVLTLEGGGRTDLAIYLVFLAITYLLLSRDARKGTLRISRKLIIITCIALALFILLFQVLAIGRYDRGAISLNSTLDNVSVYCGSEIPNLDQWMHSNTPKANNVWGSMTFIRSITYLGPKLHIDSWVYALDLPKWFSANGHWLGNVCTTFYAFIYDFGIFGLVILTILMAVISEIVYCLAGRAQRSRDIWMMIYAYLSPQLLLSFFSNKFYENFFAIPFLRTLIVIIVMHYVITFDQRARRASSLRRMQIEGYVC